MVNNNWADLFCFRIKVNRMSYLKSLMAFSKTTFGRILLFIIVVCVLLEILMFIFPELREIEESIDRAIGLK